MRQLQIDTYCPDFLEGMCACDNQGTAYEPHIAPLTPEHFTALAAGIPSRELDTAGERVFASDILPQMPAHTRVILGTDDGLRFLSKLLFEL